MPGVCCGVGDSGTSSTPFYRKYGSGQMQVHDLLPGAATIAENVPGMSGLCCAVGDGGIGFWRCNLDFSMRARPRAKKNMPKKQANVTSHLWYSASDMWA